MKARSVHIAEVPAAKGIAQVHALPQVELTALWDSIFVEPSLKEQLLAQAVLNFTLRPVVPQAVIPLHGIILLVGAPGTGKTTLARGLASRVAESFQTQDFRLVEIDPHALTSAALGKSQRAVTDLFSGTITEYASGSPLIVLLDEVETLAADRAKLSFEANPVDVHRATDAVLTQLDVLAGSQPNLLFVATSNFPQAIDEAFRSRCDLVIDIPLPNRDACKRILEDCIAGLAKAFPQVQTLLSSSGFAVAVDAAVGLDGRMLRKVVVQALSLSRHTALDPNRLSLEALIEAIRAARRTMRAGGESP